MADPLTEAHIEAQARLRTLAVQGLAQAWRSLPSYDEEDVSPFLALVLPLILAAQRVSVGLADAYVGQVLGRRPLGIDPVPVIGEVRGPVEPVEVYRRPFVTVWSDLSDGKQWADAVEAGLARAEASAALDVQMAHRGALEAVQVADPRRVFGYARAADGNACEFCRLVDRAYVKRADAMALHAHCIVGDTVVSTRPAPGGTDLAGLSAAHAVTRRWYAGEVVGIRTAAGNEFTVTPNHPVLTRGGWVAAGLLREGDCVVSNRLGHRERDRVPNEQDVPASIEQHFRSARMDGLVRVPFAAEQFHGDGGDGYVDVVALDRDLDARHLASLLQPVVEPDFTERFGHSMALACACRSRERGGLAGMPSRGVMGSGGPSLSFVSSLATGSDGVLLGGRALRDLRVAEQSINDAAVDVMTRRYLKNGIARGVLGDGSGNLRRASCGGVAEAAQFADERLGVDANGARRLLDRLAGEVQLDRVVHVTRGNLSAHVFNLVTRSGWYCANGILTHNCGCGLEPLTGVHARAAKLPDGTPVADLVAQDDVSDVAVYVHGEYGATIGSPDHQHLTPAQALAR